MHIFVKCTDNLMFFPTSLYNYIFARKNISKWLRDVLPMCELKGAPYIFKAILDVLCIIIVQPLDLMREKK